MDQFDKKIKEELHSYLKDEINIEPKEKQRLNESMSRMNRKKPRKIGYYGALAGVLVLVLLLATPMVKDFNNSNSSGGKDKISENHPEKDSHLNEKEMPIVEDDTDDDKSNENEVVKTPKETNKENEVVKNTKDTKNEQQYDEDTVISKEESNSLISVKENTIYIRNTTLGMTSSEVLTILGEPLFNGPDPEDGFYETITKFNDMYIGYYHDKAGTIYYNGSINLEQTLSEFKGPKYKLEDAYLLHSPEKQLVVKIEPFENNKYGVWLLYEDENFRYSLEQGWFTPIGSSN